LDAPGFFKLQTQRGPRYTRDGSFKLDAAGLLVTPNGDPVLGQDGPITINGNDVKIAHDGSIIVDGETIGRMLVVDFEQKELLIKETESSYLYQGDENDAETPEGVEVQQGYLEQSNVNLTEEMIKMIETQRACETAQKAIQVFVDVNSKLINDAGLV
jgi:flagellar basal-body rod protein FlgG